MVRSDIASTAYCVTFHGPPKYAHRKLEANRIRQEMQISTETHMSGCGLFFKCVRFGSRSYLLARFTMILHHSDLRSSKTHQKITEAKIPCKNLISAEENPR